MNNNKSLNPGSRNWGYTVFGEVISGMDVLEAIELVETAYSEALDAENRVFWIGNGLSFGNLTHQSFTII